MRFNALITILAVTVVALSTVEAAAVLPHQITVDGSPQLVRRSFKSFFGLEAKDKSKTETTVKTTTEITSKHKASTAAKESVKAKSKEPGHWYNRFWSKITGNSNAKSKVNDQSKFKQTTFLKTTGSGSSGASISAKQKTH